MTVTNTLLKALNTRLPHGVRITSTAKKSCNPIPIPTSFQLMDFLLLENKYAIPTNTSNPKIPNRISNDRPPDFYEKGNDV
jgi:hypothetical protein